MNRLFVSFSIPFRLIFIMWGVFFVHYYYIFDVTVFGVYPRHMYGLIGVVAMPFIHGSLAHLISNTFPVLLLGVILFYFFDRIAMTVFFQCYFATGLMVWLFARPSLHIGASGLIYALAAFLIFFGIFRKDIRSLVVSIIIVLLYGGMIYGVLPNQPGISWESHLLGGIVGMAIAYYRRNAKGVSS